MFFRGCTYAYISKGKIVDSADIGRSVTRCDIKQKYGYTQLSATNIMNIMRISEKNMNPIACISFNKAGTVLIHVRMLSIQWSIFYTVNYKIC